MKSLAAHLDSYLELRHRLGFKLRLAGGLLRRFVLFAQQRKARFIVLLRQRCVSGRAAAATVRGRQPKRIKLCPEPNSPLPTSISYDIS